MDNQRNIATSTQSYGLVIGNAIALFNAPGVHAFFVCHQATLDRSDTLPDADCSVRLCVCVLCATSVGRHLFDRVLGCLHHKGTRQAVRDSIHRNLALFHSLQ